MYIIIAIIIFGVLITTHELGHFMAAKACGVRVLEFAIGMGPAYLKKQGKETLYSLRLFPIGGFCSMEGEDAKSDDPRAFGNQPVWKRLVILSAGAAMNFLLGFILIFAVFSQSQGFRAPEITGFFEGCPYEGDLQVGDRFYKINGERIFVSSDVGEYLAYGTDGTSDIVVIRDGAKVRLDDYPITPVEYEQDGETVEMYGFNFHTLETGFFAQLKYSWYGARDFVRMVRQGLVSLISGVVGVKELSGVVGIVDMINDVGKVSESTLIAFNNIAYLSALIAINLAVMNLLPLPALDGGRILFMAITWVIEKATRRKVNPKYEGYIHATGLVLLMGLMVFVLFNDVVRIING